MRSLARPSGRGILIGAIVVVLAIALVRAWEFSRQPASGDGWQILGRQRGVGDRNQVHLIDDQAALDAAWQVLLLHTDPPTVDFGRSVVAWLTPLGTISCPSRLDDVRFDPAAHLVDGAFSLGLTLGCSSPTVGDSFLVAIDRDRLPSPPYDIRIIGPEPAGAAKGQLGVER